MFCVFCAGKVSYNRNALIGYPGFNVELDRSVRDDYLYLKCPPMQKHHMLDNFYASLSCESSKKFSITSTNGNHSRKSYKAGQYIYQLCSFSVDSSLLILEN